MMNLLPKEFRSALMQVTTVICAMAGPSWCVAVPTTISPISTTTLLPQTGVKFVELSGEIKVNEGESVALRCVVNVSVDWCQWLWRPLGETDAEPIAVKKFAPALDQQNDCSVRFLSMLKEQEGLWSCAVLVAPSVNFVEAPPTSLELLPPVKLYFLEVPKNKTVALGHSTILSCVATSTVKECLWTWYPINDTDNKGVNVKKFPAFGNSSRDCSINFKNVQKEQEGYWKCSISNDSPTNPLQAESSLAKLTTYISEPIEFIELSRDIRIPNGTHMELKCVVSSPVKECQWTHITSNNTGKSIQTIRKFPSHGNNNTNCSININVTTEEHEGFWTCGARKEDETDSSMAPPLKVSVQKQETVLVALWAIPGEKITLACQLTSPQSAANCTWQHLPNLIVGERNYTQRYIVQNNSTSGVCTILMDAKPKDLGQWRCVFSMNTKHGEWEIAAATLTLLTTDSVTDFSMNFIVGILAGLVLLMVLVITILACKCQTFRNNQSKNTLGNPTIHPKNEGEKSQRYTSHPTKKIYFHFNEGNTISTNSSCSQQSSQINHIYEPVDRYVSPCASKSVYENVE